MVGLLPRAFDRDVRSRGQFQGDPAGGAVAWNTLAVGESHTCAVASTGEKRSPSTPDVPTVREAGYPNLEMDSPGGIFGPRGMPLATRERIAEHNRMVPPAFGWADAVANTAWAPSPVVFT